MVAYKELQLLGNICDSYLFKAKRNWGNTICDKQVNVAIASLLFCRIILQWSFLYGNLLPQTETSCKWTSSSTANQAFSSELAPNYKQIGTSYGSR